MVHCGYEPSAVHHTFSSWRGFRDTCRPPSPGGSDTEGHHVTDGATLEGLDAEIGKGVPLEEVIDKAFDYRRQTSPW